MPPEAIDIAAVTTSIWEKTYYGNTVQMWVSAAALIILSMLFAKVIYWLFSGIARRMAAKTETQLDDIIIDLVEEPIARRAQTSIPLFRSPESD